MTRWAGLAAAVGGGLWAAKGTAILLTGDQPAYMFEVAPLFFALGLVGLHAQLKGRGGRPAQIGGAIAWAGVALAGVSAAYYIVTTDDSAVPLSAILPLTGLSILAGLVLLGIGVRRVDVLHGRWRSLPLAIGVGTFPLIVVGGVLEALDERLLEIPIVVLGLAWIALGFAIWRHASEAPGETGPTRA